MGILYNPDMDVELTPEEKRWMKEAEGAGTYDEWGGLIGGGVTTAGLLAAAPFTGGTTAALIPVLAPLAGQLGSAIGGEIGKGTAEEASRKLEKSIEERQKPIIQKQERLSAINQLLGNWIPPGV